MLFSSLSEVSTGLVALANNVAVSEVAVHCSYMSLNISRSRILRRRVTLNLPLYQLNFLLGPLFLYKMDMLHSCILLRIFCWVLTLFIMFNVAELGYFSLKNPVLKSEIYISNNLVVVLFFIILCKSLVQHCNVWFYTKLNFFSFFQRQYNSLFVNC